MQDSERGSAADWERTALRRAIVSRQPGPGPTKAPGSVRSSVAGKPNPEAKVPKRLARQRQVVS